MRSPKFSGKPKSPKWFLVRRVVGESMLPHLPPGTIVLALRTRRICVGNVVVIQHDGLEKIKRIAALRPGQIYVLGDNSLQSIDSRIFGWLPAHAVAGKVLLSFGSQAGRMRSLRATYKLMQRKWLLHRESRRY